jgi:putative ABC transport system permease protein
MRFFKKLFGRRRLDRDLEDELRFHLDMRGDARRFGNATLIKETCRELWSFVWLESMWRDFRYALRVLSHSPGVTAAAVAALALGIGANTAVYTIVSKAFAFDIGIKQPDRVVLIGISPAHMGEFSKNLFDPRVLRVQVKSIDRVGAFRVGRVSLSDGAGPAERSYFCEISAGGFQIMGRAPLLGRVFTTEDERTGAQVVMLSHAVWQDRYGGDRSVIGKTVHVDEVPRTIVGVMPAGMRFPEDTSLWIPFSLESRTRDPMLFGRLADGATLKAARSEIEAFARNLVGGRAGTAGEPLVDVQPILMLYGVYAARPLFIAQLVAVGFVLLIACADVANLLLGRAVVRAREISIRMAIGAGRARILRQLLVESAALSMAGGLLGWLIAFAGLRWFDRATAKMPRPAWMDFSMNPHVLFYFAAITIGTSVLFGLAPALHLARVDVNHAIKDGGQGASGGTRGRAIGNLLVAFEMALCTVLLAGAGLLIRSSLNVYRAPIGVDTSNVLTMQIDLPQGKYRRDEEQVAFHEQLKARLESLAGVEVALASALPTWGFGMTQFHCELEGSRVVIPEVNGLAISANYFRVMRAELRRGRGFQARETGGVIVNEALAAEFLGGADALGKHLKIGSQWLTVIGIAPDIQQDFRRPGERGPLIYIHYDARPQRAMFLAARTRVPPTGLAEAFRKELRSLDENLPAYDIRTLDSRIAQNRLNVGSISALLTIFAGIALVMAFVGLYAVTAHMVSQRTQEIGIRMTMGAAPRDILRLVFTQGLRPAALGLAVGLAAALGVTRVLRMTLVGVSSNDPATFAGVILVLGAACLLGCAIPARRAAKVDPMVALRCE